MSNIKKGDMSARIARAAQSSPTIGDRIEAAKLLATEHPIPESVENPKSVAQDESFVSNKEFESSNRFVSSTLHVANLRDSISSPPVAVPLELIDQNPFNARQIYKPSRVNKLAASIALHGQEQPGIATRRNGRVILAAGHYRLRALKLNNAKTMILVIHEGLTDKDLYAFSYRENAEREPQTTLDNALSWRQMLDDGLYAAIDVHVLHHHFDLHLRQEVHHVLGPAVQLGVPFLPTEALDFGHGQPGNADIRQRFTNLFQLEGLDDGGDLFHGVLRNEAV